jgi:hypothetical protein
LESIWEFNPFRKYGWGGSSSNEVVPMDEGMEESEDGITIDGSCDRMDPALEEHSV